MNSTMMQNDLDVVNRKEEIMSNDFIMPSSLAANQDQFKKLFYNVRNNDWFNNCKGYAYAHILAKDLDELILNTPGMSSPEITDLKADLADVLRLVYTESMNLTIKKISSKKDGRGRKSTKEPSDVTQIEVPSFSLDDSKYVYELPKTGEPNVIYIFTVKSQSKVEVPPLCVDVPFKVLMMYTENGWVEFNGSIVDVAYEIMNRLYIPTEEEYQYLVDHEFGTESGDGPIEWGKYTSVTDEERGWFNFCKSHWDEWHEQNQDIDELDNESRKLMKEHRKAVEDAWKALTSQEQEEWKRV